MILAYMILFAMAVFSFILIFKRHVRVYQIDYNTFVKEVI